MTDTATNYLDNNELAALRLSLKQFAEDRTEPKTEIFRAQAKATILEMVRELDRTAPPRAVIAPHQRRPGLLLPDRSLTQLVTEFEKLQEDMRGGKTGPMTNKQLQEACAKKITSMMQLIGARRDAVQVRRPGYDPRKHNPLKGVSTEKFIPFAKAFADAARDDEETPDGYLMFSQLRELDQVARHMQTYLAMLDLSNEVYRIANRCAAKGTHYWEKNREDYRQQLNRMMDDCMASIPPNLRTSAIDRAYERIVEAESIIRAAKDPDALRGAAATLKSSAMEFVMGGEDHKIITRIGEAYKHDFKTYRSEQQSGKHSGAAEHEDMPNPFDHPCETMNFVYEARWALMADMVRNILGDYKKTIANPAIRLGDAGDVGVRTKYKKPGDTPAAR